jgi:hypothetical protein
MRAFVLAGVLAFCSLLVSNSATSAPSCSTWLWQPATQTYWRECVDDHGRTYCQQADKNGRNVTTISCR